MRRRHNIVIVHNTMGLVQHTRQFIFVLMHALSFAYIDISVQCRFIIILTITCRLVIDYKRVSIHRRNDD